MTHTPTTAGRTRGATLIELMITVGVYTFLVISLFAITRDGTNSWRNIESRSSVQSALRLVERDIMTELKRASYKSVRIKQDTYQHALVFKSAMNETDVTVSNSLGDPSLFWVNTSGTVPVPIYQRYTLYYVTRPNAAEHLATYGFNCDASRLATAQPGYPAIRDDICPHKWLVRKDMYLSAHLDSASSLTNPYVEGVGNEPRSVPPGSLIWSESLSEPKIARVRLLARDILSFNLAPIMPGGSIATLGSDGSLPDVGVQVEFDVKTFKTLEASRSTAVVGNSDLTQSQFTLQLDNRIYPANP